MIVLLLSSSEAASLLKGHPDRALREYVLRAIRMEDVLPDDNLPAVVVLEQVGLSTDGRHYHAVVREFATTAQADRAWGCRTSRDDESREAQDVA